MNRRLALGFVAVLALLLARPVRAEVELLTSPLIVVPGQPITLWFHNHLPPDPDHKHLEFKAIARADGGDAYFLVGFDWMDPTSGIGVLQWGPPQLVEWNQPRQVSWWLDLPFCPSEVSLHLAVEPVTPGVASGVTLVDGVFIHECIPVPEPATIGLLGLAGASLLMRRRAA